MKKQDNTTEILKVIVGSQAHGLATPESDTDYRGVFVQPTEEILSLGGHTRTTSWIEGNDDDTSWEIGHFLMLSTKSNPTILETYLAPVFYQNDLGRELRELFPYVWDSKAVRDAFIGYGLNQRKKMLEDKDNRPNKYASAYLRTFYNAWELLRTGTFTIRIADTEMGSVVKRFKQGAFTKGEAIDVCNHWQMEVEKAYEKNKDHHPDMDKINSFLLKVRKNYWK